MGLWDWPKSLPSEISDIRLEIRTEMWTSVDRITDAEKVKEIQKNFTSIEQTIQDMAKKLNRKNSNTKWFNAVWDTSRKIDEYYKDKVLGKTEIMNINDALDWLVKWFNSFNNSFWEKDFWKEDTSVTNEITANWVEKNACWPYAIITMLKLLWIPVDVPKILEQTKTWITWTWPWDIEKAIKIWAWHCKVDNDFNNFNDYFSNLNPPCITKIDTWLFNQHYVCISQISWDTVKTTDWLSIRKDDMKKFVWSKGWTIWKV